MGVVISYGIWAVSHSFILFVVARVVGGLSKGNISLSTAIVTDVTTPEKRSRGMVSKYSLFMYMLPFSKPCPGIVKHIKLVS